MFKHCVLDLVHIQEQNDSDSYGYYHNSLSCFVINIICRPLRSLYSCRTCDRLCVTVFWLLIAKVRHNLLPILCDRTEHPLLYLFESVSCALVFICVADSERERVRLRDRRVKSWLYNTLMFSFPNQEAPVLQSFRDVLCWFSSF